MSLIRTVKAIRYRPSRQQLQVELRAYRKNARRINKQNNILAAENLHLVVQHREDQETIAELVTALATLGQVIAEQTRLIALDAEEMDTPTLREAFAEHVAQFLNAPTNPHVAMAPPSIRRLQAEQRVWGVAPAPEATNGK